MRLFLRIIFIFLLSCNVSFAQDNCTTIPDVNIQNNNAYLMAMGSGSRLEIHAADAAKKSFTKLSVTSEAGTSSISVIENTHWEVGDMIAIASTDFSWAERETHTITAVSGDGLIFTLGEALAHRHNGTMENYASGSNSWELDMRAEVALLSRNVKIQGGADSATTQYGGHTMVMAGAEQHISGAEFYQMGQSNILGKYPLHWHMLKDGGEGQYIRNTSVHGGFNKGITIHDTNLTYVEDNVVYNNIGHGFFFEDATETGNVLRGNIAFGQNRASSLDNAIIPSDFSNPTGYWVTNPNNHFIDNVAAGSNGSGIWITAEPTATGTALASGDYDTYVPREQPVGLINGFTSHSNRNRNFSMGWRLREESNGAQQAGTFIARYNEDGALFDFLVEDLTLYKGNGDGQLWIRGFGGQFNNVIMADAAQQLMFRGNNALSNSLVLADTQTNEPTTGTRNGLQLYDGGLSFENIHFVNYDADADDAFYQRKGVDVATTHSVRGLTFANGTLENRYSDRISNNGGIDARDHNGNALLDIDGSLFGTPMALITPQLDDTGLAIQINSPGWNAGPNATLFNNEAWINPPGTVIGTTHLIGANNPTLTRSDGPSLTGAVRMNETLVFADADIIYTIEPGNGAYADEVTLAVTAINRGSEVIYRLNDMPETATVEGASEVNTQEELNDSALSTFWRETSDIMWVKLIGIDPYQIPSNTPDEVANRWGNAITIHVTGVGVVSADEDFTGEHNLNVVDAGPVSVPSFVSGDSNTTDITDAMARWSSSNTWDGATIDENSVVVIGPGKTIVLDESVAVKGIIISGGELLIEDSSNLTIDLIADYILVTNGGLFQAGTETNPISTEFTLTLAGADPDFDLLITDNIVDAGQDNTVFVSCEIPDFVSCENPINVALGKETKQSSNYTAYIDRFGAANAVDGDTDGHHLANSMTHTKSENNAWWEIDLGTNYDLSTVKIWNRTNCCADRLTDFHVLVSDQPFNSQVLNTTIDQDGVSDFYFLETAGRETDISLNRSGRYLRVQLSGKNALQLAEIEVFGCENDNSQTICATSITIPERIEAEEYCEQSGVRAEVSGDIAGGMNIGYVSNGDWMDYQIIVPTTGTYTVDYRVAAKRVSGGIIQLQIDGSSIGDISIPSTGNWQTYTTVSNEVELTSGVHRLRVFAEQSGWNLNWFEFSLTNGVLGVDSGISAVQIYPNPAANYVNVDVSSYMNESITYSIYSFGGANVLNGTINSDHDDTIQIVLSTVENGMYILKIQPDNQEASSVTILVNKD